MVVEGDTGITSGKRCKHATDEEGEQLFVLRQGARVAVW